MSPQSSTDRILTLAVRQTVQGDPLALLLGAAGLYLPVVASVSGDESGSLQLVSFELPEDLDLSRLLLIVAGGDAGQSATVEGLWLGDTPLDADQVGATLSAGQSLALTLPGLAPSGPTAPEGAIVGTAGDDVLTGTAGDDVLFGAEGADTMIGGAGDDTFYVDNAGDRIVEGYGAATNGYDTVISTVDYALEDSAWVETLQAGSDAGLSLTGNKGYNVIVGGAGDDRLDGGAGNDTLFGGAGDDILIAGAGSDTLDGGEGNDTALYSGNASDYTVTKLADGRVKITGPGAYDYLSNIEALQFADKRVELSEGTAAPVIAAADDHGELLEDGSIRLDLLGNDEGRDLLVTGFQATTTQGGQVTFNQDGSFTYRPAQDFHGTDSFTYQVTDRNGATASATATLNVAAVNDAPLARPDAFEVVHGEAFHGQGLLANDSDVDGDPLSVSDFDAVSAGGGTVEVAADGSFTYKPADGFSGEDSFTYTLDDGQGGTAIGTVTLTVAAPSGPTAPEGAIVGTAGDDVLTGTAGDDVLFGAEGADTMIGGTGDDTYYVDNAGDRIVEGYGAATNGYDTVISTVDYALEDSAWVETLQAGSDAGLSLTGNKGYNVIVGGAGDDRLDGGAGNDTLFGGAGDDILIAGAGSDTLDGGEGNDTALYIGNASDYTVTKLADGRVKITGPGAYDYLSNIEALQFADKRVELVPGTTTPLALGDDQADLQEDGSVRLDLLANDEGEDLVITGFDATSDQGGTILRNEDGSFTYRPAQDFHGTDSFTYQVTDRNGATASATATLTVAAVNDAPEAQDDHIDTQEDTTIRIDVLANDRDPDGDALTIAGYDATTARGGSVMVNEDGSFSYTPAADFNGTDSFVYQVKDASGAVSSATVTVVVAAVNDAPVARDDTIESEEDTSVRIDVLANDSDVDGDVLRVSWYQSMTDKGGSVVLQEDGSLVYTPASNFSGTDSFAYKIADAKGAIGAAMAMILVAAVNDLPEAQADNFDVSYGQVFSTNGVLDNDTDVDGDTLAVVAFDAVSAHGGAIDMAADGSFSYTPAEGFMGEDVFSYTVGDGQGGAATQLVTLKVAPPAGAIVGGDGADRLQGTAGADIFFGGPGADEMIGGAGDDTYYVDNAGDRIVEGYGAATNGYDTVISTVDYALEDSAWVETLQAGSDAGLSLTGNKGYNNIIGGAGDDRLDGGAGNDKLFGGAGDDILIAGAGSDTLDGGEGNDTALYEGKAADYTVNYASDGRVVVKGEGTYDYLSNIENLQFADQTFALESGGGTTEPPAPGDGDSAPSKPPVTSPPPSGPTAGVVTGPQIVQAQGAGEIVGMQIASQSGQAAAAQTMTIGQVFAAGDLQPGQGLVARIGDADVPVQVDVKALNDDGSVRHAVLSFEAPALSAGESLDVMLKQGAAASGSTIDPLSALQAQGHDLKLEVSVQGGSPVVLDMESLLAQAKQNGTLETWLSGPEATEVRFSAAINDSLEARFDVRVNADGSVRSSVTVANEWGYKEGVTAQTYDARILVNGSEAFKVDDLNHYEWSTWREVVTTEADGSVNLGAVEPVRVLRDMAYMIETGALPRVDTSIGIEASVLATFGKLLDTKDFGPLGAGSIYQYMPGTGDRPDIGMLTEWAMAYLQSQDPRAEALMMANAEMAGSVPWHFRDAGTGEYVSVDDHPKLWLDSRGGSSNYGDDAPPVLLKGSGGGFTIDSSHQPDLSFLAYLLSGDAYHLENLQAQAATNLARIAPDYRDFGEEIIGASNQARGQAWSMRTLSNAAWISPEDSELKEYFEDRLQSHLDGLVKHYITDGAMKDTGEVEGWLETTYGIRGAIGPWQNNYFATVMDMIAGRGEEAAGQILQWQANFIAGLWLNGDQGYDPLYAAPYSLHVFDGSSGNVLTGDRFTTWEELFQHSYTAEGQAGADLELKDGLEAASFGGPGASGYAALARAALAGLVTQGVWEGSEAFGFAVEHSQTVDGDFTRTSKFAVMPEFADGSTLKAADMHVGGAGADIMVGTDVNELYAGSDGDDTIEGHGGIDMLYGGRGNDILRGGAGDDQMFGGDGDDVLDGGPGNDLMKGGKGADRFEFSAGNSGNDIIIDFDVSEDRIGTQGGYSLSSDASGNALVLFDDGGEVLLIGVQLDELQGSHFYGM